MGPIPHDRWERVRSVYSSILSEWRVHWGAYSTFSGVAGCSTQKYLAKLYISGLLTLSLTYLRQEPTLTYRTAVIVDYI